MKKQKKVMACLDWKEIQPTAIDALNQLLKGHGLKLVDDPEKLVLDEYWLHIERTK